jgi:Glycosyl transferases group 1
VKKRIVLIVQEYPQISQTYIKNEIDQLWNDYEVQIVAIRPVDYPYRSCRPFVVMTKENKNKIVEYLRDFSPDIVHGHYLHLAELIRDIAGALGVPYTIRAHSYDVLDVLSNKMSNLTTTINTQECLGVLTFPFTRPILERAGVLPHKLIDCYPVVNFQRFYDTSPNGKAIINMGAAMPKKKMEDYVALSKLVPERTFNLYAMGYDVAALIANNTATAGRVNFVGAVEPEDMLAHYKRHEWLVYTASSVHKSVGWSIAVAEAQAAGVGVCVQNIRPDIADFLGDAGYVFDTPEDAAKIIRGSVPEEMRQRGFERARRCDIAQHIKLLTYLWEQSPRTLASNPQAFISHEHKVAITNANMAAVKLGVP